MLTAALPLLLLRRGVFERDNSGEVVRAAEGARIFAREDAVGEVRREVGEEEEEARGRDLGFGVEDDVSGAGVVGAGERIDRGGAVVGRGAPVGLEAEEDGRRGPEVPVRDAVGEIEEGRERVACRGGCEVKGEGE